MKRIFAHMGFSCAVTLLAVNLIDVKFIPIIIAGLAVMLAASLLLKNYRQALAAPICFGAAIFACLVYLSVYQAAVLPAQSLSGTTNECSVYLISLPEENNGKYTYTARVERLELDGAPQGMKIRLTSDEPIAADAYQLVNAEIKFSALGSNAFSSNGYWGRGIYLNGTVQLYRATHEYKKSPYRNILHLRRDIIETLTAVIPGDAGALAAAFITGDKANLSDGAYNDFNAVGMMHLMAVSGLHLSVVTGFVYFILKRLRINSRSSAVIILITIVFYSALAGFSKSIVRAGIMLAVVLLGELAERKGDALNSLGFAVFVICLNPFAVYDASAVLSVLAVLSLVTLYPVLFQAADKRMRLSARSDNRVVFCLQKLLNYSVKSVFATVSVLIYTLPAMYLYFGRTTPAAILGNLLLIPLGSAETIAAMLTYLVNKFGFAEVIFNCICGFLGKLMLKIIHFIAETSVADITFGKYFGLILAAVLIIFGICFMLCNKRWMKYAAVFSVILIVVTIGAETMLYQNAAHIYLGQYGSGAVIYRDFTVVFGVNSRSDYYGVKRYLAANSSGIDLLIVDGGNADYAARLSQNFNCDKAIVNTACKGNVFDIQCNELIIGDEYSEQLCSAVELSYHHTADGSYITSDLLGCSFVFGEHITAAADITAINNIVTDRNGTIFLSNGAVIYDIQNNHSYSARRVEAWLK